MRRCLTAIVIIWALCACDSSDNGDSTVDARSDIATADVLADVRVPDGTTEDAGALDAGQDGAAEVEVVEEFPPRKLPFEFTRKEAGEPISAAEITEFTKQVTGIWKEADYFRWLLRTSTGVDPTTGTEDYLAWYNDVKAVKEGDTVTFKQTGGDHNMWIAGSKILSQLIGGCVLTGRWDACKATEQYCKGLTASVKGFIWDEDDPAPYLMARAVFPMDHEFTLDEETWQDDGRKKVVEFNGIYHVEDGWNAHTFEWPHNPTWGYMWVTNMRSKDDVCAITRTTTFLPYIVADAPFDWVVDACQETLDTMIGFNKDIVDYDYNIRTKDADGSARIVDEQDLGSYNWYTDFGEDNECTARLATDLISYHVPMTNDCGTGFGSLYEQIATETHYYNYPIVWDYHQAALGNALLYGHNEIALKLLEGTADRMDDYLDPDSKQAGASHGEWGRDMAVLLVKSASLGLPLTADETRLIHKHYNQMVVEMTGWPNWDLWDDSVPDGEYSAGNGIRPPNSNEGVHRDSIAMFLEYCNAPFKNPAGAQFVDCDIVADPALWGE